MAKIDFKENGSKGVESSKDGARGVKEPIIVGAFSPAKALLQMVDKFGEHLSTSDLQGLDSDRWYASSLAESWASVTANLSMFISKDNHQSNNGELSLGLYSGRTEATPEILMLVSRAFDDIDCLLRLSDLVEERLSKLKREQA
jgi:hypothetical protein